MMRLRGNICRRSSD